MSGNINKEYSGFIEIIREAMNNNTLTIFVGSGISKTHNEDYKNWSEISTILYNDLKNDNLNDSSLLSNPLKLAQIYQNHYERLFLTNKLKSLFPPQDNPGALHRAIFNLKPHNIITTNWDCLLEKEMEQDQFTYAVVACEDDLPLSQVDRKIIKMHGDFFHNNYVFTEDDYLNYEKNFPLITTYIKGIISTQTLLFLGYSFSDIDLKIIFNWLKTNTSPSVKRQSYMIVLDDFYKESDVEYFKNNNIKIIPIQTLIDDNKDYKRAYLTFFNTLITPVIEENLDNIEDPIEFVYYKIKDLDNYNIVLKKHLKDRLTNCGFEYDAYSRAILIFYNQIQTFDYNEKIRKVYQSFINEIENNKENPFLMKTVEILKKADIHGIAIKGEFPSDNISYFDFDNGKNIIHYDICNDILNFSFLIKENNQLNNIFLSIMKYYFIGDIEKAFCETEKIIEICKKTNQLKNLFIAYHNYNLLLQELKHGFFETSKDYNNKQKYNLEDEFYALSYSSQMQLKELLNFLTFGYVYKQFYYVQSDLEEIESKIEIIKNGGFSFTNQGPKYPAEHKNLIDFSLENYILIEPYSEFMKICKKYVRISILRQFQSKQILLEKYEIYSCIKYFSTKDLEKELDEVSQRASEKLLVITDDDKSWLISSLRNSINYYKEKPMFNGLERYINNCLYILSIIRLESSDIDLILDLIIELLTSSRNSIMNFETANKFFALQYNLYKTIFSSEKINSLISEILNKFINGNCNGYESLALLNNYLSNLFAICSVEKINYNNKVQIQKLIEIEKLLSQQDRLSFKQNLLMNLYQIVTDECKQILEAALKDISCFENSTHNLNIVSYKLSLLLMKLYSVDDEFLTELNFLLENLEKNTGMNSLWYFVLRQLKNAEKIEPKLERYEHRLSTILESKKDFFKLPSNI